MRRSAGDSFALLVFMLLWSLLTLSFDVSLGASLFSNGVREGDLYLGLFMTPFNLGMVSCWCGVWSGWRKPRPVRAFTRDGRTHVTLAEKGPVYAGLFAAGVTACASVLILGLVGGGSGPPSSLLVLAWSAVVGVGLFVGLRRWTRLASGESDLILDEGSQRLSLPALLERTVRLEVPCGEVQALTVESHPGEDDAGDPVTLWRPTLAYLDEGGARRSVPIVEWREEEQATALVDWLRSRLEPGGPWSPSAPGSGEDPEAGGLHPEA